MNKKFGIGLSALIIAISAAAFTRPDSPAEDKKYDTYWFLTDDAGNNPVHSAILQTSSAFSGCSGSTIKFCAREYTSVDVDGNGLYYPTSSPTANSVKKPN
jgi:hypothetical protein